jgi:type II secretory pathway component PulF
VAIVAMFICCAALGGIVLDVLAGAELTRRALTMERFARGLAMLVSAGVTRGRAVRLAVDGSLSVALQRHLAARTDREMHTTPLATLLAGCSAVPGALLSQAAVADATGDYVHTMRRYADMLEEEEAPR